MDYVALFAMVIVPLAIAGVAGVLFVRLLRWMGLGHTVAMLLGNAAVPLGFFVMMNWQRNAAGSIPWVGIVVPFLSGFATSHFYFRRRK